MLKYEQVLTFNGKKMTAPEKSREMRRTPQQQRSQERVDAILDAAAELIAEVGYEAATTNEIARRANTSIGSLYRFFPDKAALMNALTRRFIEESYALFEKMVTDETIMQPFPQLIYQVMDAYNEFYEAQPESQAIYTQAQLSPELWDLAEELNGQMIRHLADVLGTRLPHLPPEKRELLAFTCIAGSDGIDRALAHKDERFRKKANLECLDMIVRYLEPYFTGNE